jgi:hypothetical protein
MKDKNNYYDISGVIYAKPMRLVPDKKNKNNGQPWEFPSIILEVKREYDGREFIELPEFDLGKGVSTEDFSVRDNVTITFSLSGREIEYKDRQGEKAKMHKTTAKALYIKHSDIQSNDTRAIGTSFVPAHKDDSIPPLPYSEGASKEEDESDLPF